MMCAISVLAENEEEATKIAKTINGFHITSQALRLGKEIIVSGRADFPISHEKVKRFWVTEPPRE